MQSPKLYQVSREEFLSATQPQGAFRSNGAVPVRLVRATIHDIHDNERPERPGPNNTTLPAHPCQCPICHEIINGGKHLEALIQGEFVITGCQPSCYGGNPVYHLACIQRYLDKPRADRPGYYEHRCPCCKRELYRLTKMGFTERLHRKTTVATDRAQRRAAAAAATAANTFERAYFWMDTSVPELMERRRLKKLGSQASPAGEEFPVE